jgi:hypothetical protein
MNVVEHDDVAKRGGSVFGVDKIDAFAYGQFTGFHFQQMIPLIASGGNEETLFI